MGLMPGRCMLRNRGSKARPREAYGNILLKWPRFGVAPIVDAKKYAVRKGVLYC